jgi:ferrochelatase
MTGDGVRRAIGFILSPHQTEASWERYQKNVAEAREELGGAVPEIKYSPGWHDHPLFVQTWTEQIEAEMEKIAPANRERTVLLFTAHSIPAAMAARSPYVEQIEQSCSLIAARLGHHRWSLAYQSRSGSPKESWLEPDIGEALTSIAAQGAAEIIAAAIGFVSDHVEVLYDLDIEARKKAESLGLLFRRASCPNDRPTFIRMMAEVVEAMHSAPGRRS